MSSVRDVHRILIYRIGNLGDIICTIPAMVAIRRRFPTAWIGLLTNKAIGGNPDPEAILEGNDFLDTIITYNPRQIKNFQYLRSLMAQIRKLKPELLVYFSLSKTTRRRLLRDWLFFKMAGCRKLIGFNKPKPEKVVLKDGIKMPIFPQEVDRLMSLVTPLGVDPTKVEFRLPVKDKDREYVDRIWERYNLNRRKPVVAICPGGKFPVNWWPVSRYSQVASTLMKKYKAQIILIGGPAEEEAGKKIVKTSKTSVVNLIGQTTYMQSAEVLRRCDLLVSNDCGPAHLAAAVGTPVVGIHSSRNYPGAWHPWGNIHTILRNDSVSCRFCFKTDCETKECINGITVDQVVEACDKYLSSSPSKGEEE